MSRTGIIKAVVMALPLFVLSACFGTEEELIRAGEAVLPIDQAVTLCKQDESECAEFIAAGDGYINSVGEDAASEQDALRLRFSGFGQIDGRQLYVLEVTSQNPVDTGTLLGVARRIAPGLEAQRSMDVVMLECGDLDEEEAALFTELGGTIEAGGYVSSCAPSDLTMLKNFLSETLRDELSSDEWWAENGPD